VTVRAAVVGTTPELGAVATNLADLDRTLTAMSGAADIAVLPELFSTGYHLADLDLAASAEPLDGPTVAEMRRLAHEHKTALIASILESDGGNVYDTALVVDRCGEVVATYRKTHLHPSEVAHFGAGEELVVAEVAGLRVGLAICVEHAYPEIFTELALAGAHLVAVPVAEPDGFAYLLDLRTRARAQDNQMFVATANFAGNDGHTAWCGRSAIVDPRGTVLAGTGSHAGWAVAEIDPDTQTQERLQEPVLQHRRPGLYGRLHAQ